MFRRRFELLLTEYFISVIAESSFRTDASFAAGKFPTFRFVVKLTCRLKETAFSTPLEFVFFVFHV
jgi:hypothetical protein